jgi:hypothetical protein
VGGVAELIKLELDAVAETTPTAAHRNVDVKLRRQAVAEPARPKPARRRLPAAVLRFWRPGAREEWRLTIDESHGMAETVRFEHEMAETVR